MRRTPRTRLLLVAVVTAAAAAAVLRLAESRGATLLPVPTFAWLVVLLIAAVVAALAWTVRQYTRGKRPEIDLIMAARTVVLATASAYTGALLTGWYAAEVLVTLGDLQLAPRRDVAISAAVATVAALVLAVVGLVAERWCEVPPADDGPSDLADPGARAAVDRHGGRCGADRHRRSVGAARRRGRLWCVAGADHPAAGPGDRLRRARRRPADPQGGHVQVARRRAVRADAVRRRPGGPAGSLGRHRPGAAAHRVAEQRRLDPRSAPRGGRPVARPARHPRRGAAGRAVSEGSWPQPQPQPQPPPQPPPPPPPPQPQGHVPSDAGLQWRRFHPVTPVIKGWKVLLVLLVILAQ